ncbi:MAG: hypothetical protein R3A47_10900, partial [Polyangiales bacterium]
MPKLGCVEQLTGNYCAGYSTGAPLTVGGEQFYSSMSSIGYLIDEPGPDYGKVYFAAHRSVKRDLGFGCVDLTKAPTDPGFDCGFIRESAAPVTESPTTYGGCPAAIPGGNCAAPHPTPITGGGVSPFRARVDSLAEVDDKLYAIGFQTVSRFVDLFGTNYSYQAFMYCMDLTTKAACAGYPINLSVAAPAGMSLPAVGDNLGQIGAVLSLQADGTRIYFQSNNNLANGNANVVGCFDTSTSAACPGWETVKNVAGQIGLGIFLLNPASPGPHSFCATSSNYDAFAGSYSNRSSSCYDPNGNSISNPFTIPATTTMADSTVQQTSQGFSFTSTYVPSLNRTYLPLSFGETNEWGAAYCFDWDTNASCTGFGTNGVATWKSAPGVVLDTEDYSYIYYGGCMWGNGDSGIIWSFDPDTGANPCIGASTIVASVSPSTHICDGATKTYAWSTFRIDNLGTLSDYVSLTATLQDSSGTAVPGYVDVDLLTVGGNVTSVGVLDIS